jgi:hypothetical protein
MDCRRKLWSYTHNTLDIQIFNALKTQVCCATTFSSWTRSFPEFWCIVVSTYWGTRLTLKMKAPQYFESSENNCAMTLRYITEDYYITFRHSKLAFHALPFVILTWRLSLIRCVFKYLDTNTLKLHVKCMSVNLLLYIARCNVRFVYLTFIWSISHSTKNWTRHHKCTYVFM